jgi:hypothetical protein
LNSDEILDLVKQGVANRHNNSSQFSALVSFLVSALVIQENPWNPSTVVCEEYNSRVTLYDVLKEQSMITQIGQNVRIECAFLALFINYELMTLKGDNPTLPFIKMVHRKERNYW